MNLLACLASLFALLVQATFANTEKVIFAAPAAVGLPDSGPSLNALQLSSLGPNKPSIRTSLPVAFPSEALPLGTDAWYLLRGLNQQQRYEVRACWVATQPTNLRLNIYNISHVFDEPQLIQALATYSNAQQSLGVKQVSSFDGQSSESLLFLRTQSAADFFTTNQSLMQQPPLVDVELILDPYVANAIPWSLGLTAVYLAALAVGSWSLSGTVWRRLFIIGKPHAD
ncbi:hypothetical protein BAUCODRAFT_70175 [Baudoinia panamericana UAMH 10762]|uniref:Protein PBN1 n=1 Tax=Baudoinia panamericana (strain UAMH 10762) TaxID=717646 RepID=M2NCU3_BAUPA|nr:uncharacterized protein BAUCODRAFT_70175 [Baudoinia panamericana UAMH 10762]EMC96745.1 hypothetical protein BAUCODRAFT_70175 [Baudoinia panamericana UAMH 10762]